MIPKIIHYVWFGDNMPDQTITLIRTWKSLNPDYTIMSWNEETFDVNISKFTQDAFVFKKWAFLADFIRFWALYNYGGIWLDTDVEVFRSFDPLLDLEYFIGNNSLNTRLDFGLIAFRKNHPFAKLGLETYSCRSFVAPCGNLNCEFTSMSLIESVMNRAIAQKGINVIQNTFDFHELSEKQKDLSYFYYIDNSILNSYYNTNDGKSFASHLHHGTWISNNRINSFDYSDEEILGQIEKCGADPNMLKEYRRIDHGIFLQTIANTILANMGMQKEKGLINGQLCNCVFLYFYSRYSGIKEYYILAEGMLGNIIKNMDQNIVASFSDGLSGIGISLIILITNDFVEDSDDNDSLNEIDEKLFKLFDNFENNINDLLSASMYFIYRSTKYRAGLNLNTIHTISYKISIIIDNNKEKFGNSGLKSALFEYIKKNVEVLSKSTELSLCEMIRSAIPFDEFYIENVWYNLICEGKIPVEFSNERIFQMCESCYYDASKVVPFLTAYGLYHMLK